jgi:hypothetical protein
LVTLIFAMGIGPLGGTARLAARLSGISSGL